MLRNRVYVGSIVHKGTVHPGAHAGIVEPALFDAAQVQLDSQRRRHAGQAERTVVRAPLTGRLFDAAGEPMSPTFSRGARGGVYRYYVSASLQAGGTKREDGIVRRVPAPAIEQLVTGILARLFPHEDQPLVHLRAVRLRGDGIELQLPGKHRRTVSDHLEPGEELHRQDGNCLIAIACALPLRGGGRTITAGQRDDAAPDPTLVSALRKAHDMLGRDCHGRPTIAAAPGSAYERKVLRLAFLDPALQADILAGRHPRGFRLETFLRCEVPLAWQDQRAALGWPAKPSS